MAKPLAGKRWFEAQGRRASDQGKSLLGGMKTRQAWPKFARAAYSRGYLIQQPNPHKREYRTY